MIVTDIILDTLSAIDEMEENGDVTTVDNIAEFMGISYHKLYQRLRRYEPDGLVEVDENGEYSLTDEGLSILEKFS